jgi:CRISPR-associated protein Cas2
MFIVSYDFESDRRRTRFSKFLEKYGRRLQYSVFEIKNSPRALRNIITEIEMSYAPHFTNADSIVIFPICEACEKKIYRYGYAVNEEQDVVIFE